MTSKPLHLDVGYKTFLIRYRYQGAEWALSIPATDIEDARARLARLPYATIDGELVMELPGFTGPLAGITAAFRNAVRWLTNPI